MSLFPILDGKALPDLTALFASDPLAHGVEPEEVGLFLQESAAAIARSGDDGAAFLLQTIARADAERQRAILLALSFLRKDSRARFSAQLKGVLASFLSSADPSSVANAIDSVSSLGFTEMADQVRPRLDHPSPYVVGSVLRFLGSHFPWQARPILIEALKSPEAIVRQNAIDELDELECSEALPNIMGLINDPDKDVRAAAIGAAAHLGSGAA